MLKLNMSCTWGTFITDAIKDAYNFSHKNKITIILEHNNISYSITYRKPLEYYLEKYNV